MTGITPIHPEKDIGKKLECVPNFRSRSKLFHHNETYFITMKLISYTVSYSIGPIKVKAKSRPVTQRYIDFLLNKSKKFIKYEMLRRQKSVEMGHFGPIKVKSWVGFHSSLNLGLGP